MLCHLFTCIAYINLIYFDFIKILKMVTDDERVSVCLCFLSSQVLSCSKYIIQ